MKIVFIFFLTISQIYAQTDFSTGLRARSYPSVGVNINTNLGYTFSLWDADLLSGLIRADLNHDSSFVINEASSRITFYPVKFIGIGHIHKFLKSDYERFTYFNCDKINCKSQIKEDITFGKLAFGLGNIVSILEYRQGKHLINSKKIPTADYNHALELNFRDDHSIRRDYFLGYKSQTLTTGLYHENLHYFKNSKNFEMTLFLYELTNEKISYQLAFGNFVSSDINPSPLLITGITYTFAKKGILF